MQFLMVDEYFRRQPLKNPRMSECLVRSHSCLRIPIQASFHKVYEAFILAFQYVLYCLCAWLFTFAPRVGNNDWGVIGGEEFFLSLTDFQYFLRRYSAHFHHQTKLLSLVLSWEQ